VRLARFLGETCSLPTPALVFARGCGFPRRIISFIGPSGRLYWAARVVGLRFFFYVA